MKGVGDYVSSPASFYTDENLLYLPGANYPDKKKIVNPQFAIAFNTKLQRNDPSGQKQRTKMDQITQPAKTVAFLEQGCLNEDRTLEVQSRNDYDGSPKGSAKSFVGRYGGKGYILFIDGHVELVAAKDLLTETGAFPFPQSDVVWTRTPEENPNKDATHVGSARKQK
jgi:prepilin-type processing-associated H-X9-DG protein